MFGRKRIKALEQQVKELTSRLEYHFSVVDKIDDAVGSISRKLVEHYSPSHISDMMDKRSLNIEQRVDVIEKQRFDLCERIEATEKQTSGLLKQLNTMRFDDGLEEKVSDLVHRVDTMDKRSLKIEQHVAEIEQFAKDQKSLEENRERLEHEFANTIETSFRSLLNGHISDTKKCFDNLKQELGLDAIRKRIECVDDTSNKLWNLCEARIYAIARHLEITLRRCGTGYSGIKAKPK